MHIYVPTSLHSKIMAGMHCRPFEGRHLVRERMKYYIFFYFQLTFNLTPWIILNIFFN